MADLGNVYDELRRERSLGDADDGDASQGSSESESGFHECDEAGEIAGFCCECGEPSRFKCDCSEHEREAGDFGLRCHKCRGLESDRESAVEWRAWDTPDGEAPRFLFDDFGQPIELTMGVPGQGLGDVRDYHAMSAAADEKSAAPSRREAAARHEAERARAEKLASLPARQAAWAAFQCGELIGGVGEADDADACQAAPAAAAATSTPSLASARAWASSAAVEAAAHGCPVSPRTKRARHWPAVGEVGEAGEVPSLFELAARRIPRYAGVNLPAGELRARANEVRDNCGVRPLMEPTEGDEAEMDSLAACATDAAEPRGAPPAAPRPDVPWASYGTRGERERERRNAAFEARQRAHRPIVVGCGSSAAARSPLPSVPASAAARVDARVDSAASVAAASAAASAAADAPLRVACKLAAADSGDLLGPSGCRLNSLRQESAGVAISFVKDSGDGWGRLMLTARRRALAGTRLVVGEVDVGRRATFHRARGEQSRKRCGGCTSSTATRSGRAAFRCRLRRRRGRRQKRRRAARLVSSVGRRQRYARLLLLLRRRRQRCPAARASPGRSPRPARRLPLPPMITTLELPPPAPPASRRARAVGQRAAAARRATRGRGRFLSRRARTVCAAGALT